MVGFFLEDWPGAVGGAVVDDNYLVRDAAEIQLEMQVLDGGCDAAEGWKVGRWDSQKTKRPRDRVTRRLRDEETGDRRSAGRGTGGGSTGRAEFRWAVGY